MNQLKDPEYDYVLGHSRTELDRLMLQAAILRPITERLLRAAGVTSGCRVLDLGSGAGDVSLLAAELVGPAGSVTGIDRSAEAVAAATGRAAAGGFRNVSFVESSVEDFQPEEQFDCVIGRYVVIHQPDPVAFLRTAARLTRPGGVLAFHEMDVHRGGQSLPRAPLWQQTAELTVRALSAAAPHCDAGGRFIEHFLAAGLGDPAVTSETIVGGGKHSPIYAWLSDTLRALLPLVANEGITARTVGLDTLEARLRAEVVELRSQVEWPPQFCAWTAVPGHSPTVTCSR